jgi:prepilin-type N-terminal cleavage/methylation domain-containing protein
MQRRSGFTLIELMVGLCITALLVTVLMAVYTQGTRGYYQIESQQLIDRAVETALMEMETATQNAMYAEMMNNRLVLTFPQDLSVKGKAIPYKQNEQPVYRTGELYAYYLSNSTGNPAQSGTTLWRGQVNSDGSITPEAQLASPITRFIPTVTTESSGMYVVIDMEAKMTIRAQTYKAVRQRVYLLQNANTWR